MTDVGKREAARQFYQKWANRGKEDEEDRSYWIDILTRIMGVENATDYIEFQKKVIVDGNTKRIDAYIPETKVLIEQKSRGIALDKKIKQSGGIELTPYEQAKRYNDNLPYDEKAKWIVISNFAEIWIYDMNVRVPRPVKMEIINMQEQYSMIEFLVDEKTKKVSLEMEISLQAGELIGKMYDAFLRQYKNPESPKTLKSLNKLCVRIVFCLYAEDAGIFGRHGIFHDYLAQYDAKGARKALRELFRVLNQKQEKRDKYLYDDDSILAAFPYVNGGLFADEDIEIPPFTDEILNMILKNASDDFDWSMISPTIFGAVFESTLNPETRRSGGMHYTSVENIHKVIDPLFLDELQSEFLSIRELTAQKIKEQRLREFQKKLVSLKWLDPACGSGNFLTETYISIRRLENEVIKELLHGQMMLGYEGVSPIKVSINQFYGIEINDFAVTVAKTALWIAESQMMKETEDIVLMDLDFLPLTTNACIVEGNALRIDWEDVVPKKELSYIIGNPPFVGARWMSKEQKDDVLKTFTNNWKNIGNLDYVSCWYKKALEYILETNIRVALVSTNSISQGESVINLWKPLFALGLHIDFAYRTFQWNSEVKTRAHVHCVIIGFSVALNSKNKVIYVSNKPLIVKNINGYLVDADNIFIDKRKVPISNVPPITLGGQAIDDGNFILTAEEKDELLKKEPQAEVFIRPYMMGKDFIKRKPRYCIWLVDADLGLLKKCPHVMEKIKKVREFRMKSSRLNTRRAANTPTLFATIVEHKNEYVAIPKVSSETRRYIPMDFLSRYIIPGDKLFTMPNASLYHFGVLTSNVHMAWMRAVCGRLKSDYSYSNTIVYNNFPWPFLTKEQRKKIEKTAKNILDVRLLYPESTLADLYDPLIMPPELRKAHQKNDIAVMQAYGFSIRDTSETDCVAKLMKMYQTLTQK